jgi:hypothetical protein
MSRLRMVPFFAAIKILPGGCPPFLRIIRLEWISSPLEHFPPFYAHFEWNSRGKIGRRSKEHRAESKEHGAAKNDE